MTTRIVVGFLLGIVSLFLMFLLGEGVDIPAKVHGAEQIEAALILACMGGYFFVTQCLLSRGNPALPWKHWPIILALVLPLLATAVIALLVEVSKQPGMQVLGLSAAGLACSFAGAALSSRCARKRLAKTAEPVGGPELDSPTPRTQTPAAPNQS